MQASDSPTVWSHDLFFFFFFLKFFIYEERQRERGWAGREGEKESQAGSGALSAVPDAGSKLRNREIMT